jgi:hypothetical protein
MRDSTKIKLAIEAIERRQREYVFEANMYKRLGAEYGKNAAEKYDRLESAKEFLLDLLEGYN